MKSLLIQQLIAKAFKETGIIERYGTGIKRIINICENYGIVIPKFEEVFNGFKVTLFKEKLNVTKDDREKVIIKLFLENPEITTDEIAVKLNLTRRTILREIENLKTQNKIRRVGGRKTGYWQIINNKNK